MIARSFKFKTIFNLRALNLNSFLSNILHKSELDVSSDRLQLNIDCSLNIFSLDMFSLRLYRFGLLSKASHSYLRSYLRFKSIDTKTFCSTSKLNKNDSEERQLPEVENQLKCILSKFVDSSSPLNNLIQRLVTKPWISLIGEKTRSVAIKERKDTKSKSQTFRLAFDLPGFKQEEIDVVLSDCVVYIEAKKEELGSDGSKSWREFSFECPIPKQLNLKTVNASIDSDGLLLIEGDLPQEYITGIKKSSGKKSKQKK